MKISKQPEKNRTAIYEITIPTKDIDARYKKSLEDLAKNAEVEGFRKGKAPTDMAEKSLGKDRIYDHMIQHLLPDIYKKVLEQDKLEPVISPKIELQKAKEGEDWVIVMSIALQPTVKIPDYKKIAADVKADAKKDDIWVPGKDEKADSKLSDKEVMERKEKLLNNILQKIIDKTTIELSDIIVEQEVNNRLSRLVDDVRNIGLTIDAYFQSRNTTQEQVKEEFKKDIENTYKLEYALNEIGDKEDITVDDEEIKKMLQGIPDGPEKADAQKNAYVYAMMMRKQKILDFLSAL